MKVISSLPEWRSFRGTLQDTVGFVPTMGALHAGHASLLERSRRENQISVLSIYVNPTQFDDPKDLNAYPKTWDQDLKMAEGLGVDYVLHPKYEEIYPDGYRYKILENDFSKKLCGASRPGHFDGVLTVVMKLLNLVRPRKAYFGEKDFQQYRLIADLCAAFFLDVEIVPCPIVRESDGLAMSSRNLRLSKEQRNLAPRFYELLRQPLSDERIAAELRNAGFSVDYVETHGGRRFGAVRVGSADNNIRLIDNVPV